MTSGLLINNSERPRKIRRITCSSIEFDADQAGQVRQSAVADPDFGAVSGWFCERAAFVAGLLNVLWPRKMRECTE